MCSHSFDLRIHSSSLNLHIKSFSSRRKEPFVLNFVHQFLRFSFFIFPPSLFRNLFLLIPNFYSSEDYHAVIRNSFSFIRNNFVFFRNHTIFIRNNFNSSEITLCLSDLNFDSSEITLCLSDLNFYSSEIVTSHSLFSFSFSHFFSTV